VDKQDFYSAVAASPDDDSVRLAFADWLEERGDPQGGFVRLQIQGNDAAREPALLEKWAREQFGAAYCVLCSLPVFHRGFAAGISVRCEDWLELGPLLVRRAPLVQVHLVDREPWGNSTFADMHAPWGWEASVVWQVRPRYFLPPVLHSRLRDERCRRGRVCCYKSMVEAANAVSSACLEYGRTSAPLVRGDLRVQPAAIR
jgi:uncharacterized protein (TIGR02996 family)